jgi:heparan-alpha-glucosaminide N-acetyltransferase
VGVALPYSIASRLGKGVTFRQMLPWAFSLVVIGINSIAAYLMAHLFEDFLTSSFRIHLDDAPFRLLGPPLELLLRRGAVLLTYCLMLFWMYRRKVFLRI